MWALEAVKHYTHKCSYIDRMNTSVNVLSAILLSHTAKNHSVAGNLCIIILTVKESISSGNVYTALFWLQSVIGIVQYSNAVSPMRLASLAAIALSNQQLSEPNIQLKNNCVGNAVSAPHQVTIAHKYSIHNILYCLKMCIWVRVSVGAHMWVWVCVRVCACVFVWQWW